MFLSNQLVHGTTAHDHPDARPEGCQPHGSLAFETPYKILRSPASDGGGFDGIGQAWERDMLQLEANGALAHDIDDPDGPWYVSFFRRGGTIWLFARSGVL